MFGIIVEDGRRIITARSRSQGDWRRHGGVVLTSEPTRHRANENMTSTSTNASTCLTNDNDTFVVKYGVKNPPNAPPHCYVRDDSAPLFILCYYSSIPPECPDADHRRLSKDLSSKSK